MKFITAVFVSSPLVASTASLPAASIAASKPSKNVVQVAASAPQFSTFVTLVRAAGLTKALSGKQKLTVFAPTNSAFAALKRKDSELFAKVGQDPALLKQVLLYHVVAGSLAARQVVSHRSLKTLQGQRLKVATRGSNVFINQARVVTANIRASDGIIHAINSVLLPRLSAPPTVPVTG